MSAPQTNSELIAEAMKKAADLRAERAARPEGNHPDPRVPGEILSQMQQVSIRAALIREQNERWRTATIRNISDVELLEKAYAELNLEMAIALRRCPPTK